jgi:integrase
MNSIHVPAYRLHKPSGQAVVTVGGRTIYLGKHRTAASRQAYNRTVAEFMAAGGRASPRAGPAPDFCVTELIAAYWRWACGYYVKDGRATSELTCIKIALRHLRALYGDTIAAAFSPLALKAIRQSMLDVGREATATAKAGLARRTINGYIDRIRRAFKWAVGEGLIPPSVYQGLQAVPGLRKGRSEAREAEPVRPVAETWVRKTLPFLPPAVAAMVELQVLTGMRSGEVVIIRARDLNMTGPMVWQYRPAAHKTEHHGHDRLIDLGPKAQAVIRPWLKPDLQACLFSPREGEAGRNAARREARRSAMTPSARARRRRADRRRGGRPLGEHYSPESYRRAVARGIERANKQIAADLAARGVTDPEKVEAAKVPAWYPHQVRHTFATNIRRQYGLEAARVLLGHHSVGVTEIYAERDLEVAARVAAEVG